jgi:C-terminal processing protease CtpA/Prc
VAELFAHELRAFNRGKVFLAGEATRGISTVQEPFPLAYVEGAALLTVGRVVPYGATLEKPWNDGGVQPNAITPETKDGIIYSILGDEQQLKGALNILRIETEAANNS